MSWFGKKVHPKEEHPMQEIWDQGEWYRQHSPPEGGSVIAPPSNRPRIIPPVGPGGIIPIPSHGVGQSNRATLRLMKSIEERL